MPDTINVGKRSTKPVFKYSINNGIKKTNARTSIKTATLVKNANGLYSLNKVAIVERTFIPSENVFNFDTLPDGRSRYCTGISSRRKFLSTA